MRKSITTIMSIALAAISVTAHPIDFSKIRHWTGTGPNCAALVIQFNGETFGGSDAYVWGYRWEDGQNPTGEAMMKAICSNSSRLSMLTQYTGSIGSTLCGVGYSLNQEMLCHVFFDFDKAKEFEFINFDYYEVNSFMGQTEAPGDNAPVLGQAAIDEAIIGGTHYIQHPFDYGKYGYPAYDYDCWDMDEEIKRKAGTNSYEPKWLSAWYEGYWSYWCANSPNQDWMYSGNGFTGRALVDGAVDGWSFTQFESAMVGGMGEGVAPCENVEILYMPKKYGVSVDASKCVRSVGEGAQAIPLIVKFGNPAKIDNVALMLRFDSEMPSVQDVLSLLDNDPAFSLDGATLNIDADGDGVFNKAGDDTYLAGEWRLTEYEDCIVLSCEEENTSKYLLYLPAAGRPAVVIPDALSYNLSDNKNYIPVFVQRDMQYDAINYTWYRRSDTEAITSSNSSDIIKSVSTTAATFGQLAYTGSKAGDVYLHVRVRTGKGASYTYSNICRFTLLSPEIPLERIEFAQSIIDAPLNSTIENEMIFYPGNATYTGLTYSTSNNKVATANASAFKTTKTPGSATITVASIWNPEVKTSFDIVSALRHPVTDLAIKDIDGDVIVLNPKQMIGIIADITPADADIPDFTVTLTGNGDSKESFIASMYKVNYWDENNTRIQFYELSGHRVGECTLTLTSADGSNISKTYTIRVEEQDRTPLADGYLDGTLVLNEEWFGHTNGGMNYITPEGEMMYQVYERENPGMSFGSTSQYASIWSDRIITVSKQATDSGDPLPGGGRVVVADATTLKRIGSIENLMFGEETKSADGRAVVGATPNKAYVSTNNGIYIVDINEVKVTGKIGDFAESGSSGDNLYNGQIGDMVHAGAYVFGIKQNTGAFAIDVNTDKVIRQSSLPTVQGITQIADGHVWIASIDNGCAHFTCIDPETLSEIEDMSVTFPASVGAPTCSWGAWRNTPFVGCNSRNTIWFSTGGGIAGGSASDKYYGWDVGSSPNDIVPVFDLGNANLVGSNSRVKQKTYGTLRYDDRSGELIVMTTDDSSSGHYRYNWIHFINPSDGSILRTIALRPYYWFQSFVIFPDKHDAVIDLDNISVNISDGDKVIDISELVTDADNIDYNINIYLDVRPNEAMEMDNGAQPAADIRLEDKILTISPRAAGSRYFTLTAESNGRAISKTIGVQINDIVTSINAVSDKIGNIACDGTRIIFNGFNGSTFDMYDLNGRKVMAFDIDDNNYIAQPGDYQGAYVLTDYNGVNAKIILK